MVHHQPGESGRTPSVTMTICLTIELDGEDAIHLEAQAVSPLRHGKQTIHFTCRDRERGVTVKGETLIPADASAACLAAAVLEAARTLLPIP